MSRLKKVFTNWRVIICFVVLLFFLFAISPNPFADGVAVRSVLTNSSAALAGMESPKATSTLMNLERITAMNNIPIEDMTDYNNFISELKSNRTITVKTTKGLYRVTTQGTNDSVDLGLSVYDAPTTNIRKGLELQGGTRVLLQPETILSDDEMATLIKNMNYRLNVYGLSDLIIKEAGDLSGNQYVLVEIAGAKEEEVNELLAKQGKFQATIGNSTVFKGGSDITYVCRSGDCSGIDTSYGCQKSGDGWMCRFNFAISLTPEAAQRQADLTRNLSVINEGSEDYLSEKIILYLDDTQVDELNIGADLRGRAVTDIQISGSGIGTTEELAATNSLENMKRLQTILITGSLPVKLNVVKVDTISPVFGKELLNNSLLIGAVALIAVSFTIFLRYKKIQLVIPIIMTSLIELLILLGVAALMRQNLDLSTIAGIIISIGTGVNDQIVITDEALRGVKSSSEIYNWKERIKSAFVIIMGAYFTLFFAMLPLIFAGAGLLRGFAIASIVGLTAGVLITRPAYAQVIEILIKEE